MNKLNNLPQVSLNTMNEVHEEEVSIINKLFYSLDNEDDFNTISECLATLLMHVQEHFSSEEKLMKESRYPSFRMHKANHDKVLNELRYAQMQFRNKKDKDLLREYLEDNIVAWLDQHIKAMDVPMADFILHIQNVSNNK